MTIPILDGSNVRLRPAHDTDAKTRFALGNDFEIMEMFGASRDQIRPMSIEQATQEIRGLMEHPFAWAIENQTSLIGSVRLDRVDHQDRRASMAIGILDPRCLGRGFGTESMNLVLQYAFGDMRLHRIGVRVLAYNRRAIQAYQKCGFLIEGREREAGFVNGHWHDDLIMGLLSREFRGAAAEAQG
jgi:RimJ/RimL family protein N-acetyltransferase